MKADAEPRKRRVKCAPGKHVDVELRGGRFRCSICHSEFPCLGECDHVDCMEVSNRPSPWLRTLLGMAFLFAFASGCATVNKVSLIAAEASIVADWHSTMWAADRGWSGGRTEGNALLGLRPSPGVVSCYMAGTVAAVGITYAVLPKWARAAVMLGITAVEISTVHGNIEQSGTSW